MNMGSDVEVDLGRDSENNSLLKKVFFSLDTHHHGWYFTRKRQHNDMQQLQLFCYPFPLNQPFLKKHHTQASKTHVTFGK